VTRDELADELLEIRRYVRTDVEYVRQKIEPLFDVLDLFGNRDPFRRIMSNLLVASRFIQVDPEVLEGYLYAAAFELRCGKGN